MGIRDDLEKAYNAAENPESAGSDAPEGATPTTAGDLDPPEIGGGAAPTSPEGQDERPGPGKTGEEGSQGSGDLEESQGVKGDTPTDSGDPAVQTALEPLPTWAEADKEAFKAAPRDVQEWILRRDKEMNSDYQRKTTEIADFRKTWSPVQEMFAPYIQQGVNPQVVIQQWANVAQQLERDPRETLLNLARQYRVDLTSQPAAGNSDASQQIWEDPSTAVLRQQLEEQRRQMETLTAHLQQRDQLETQSRQTQLETEIQAFASQKNEAGELAHPHFDDLLPHMMQQARIMKAQGLQPNLKDLYDQTVWANPDTRQKVLAAQQAAAAKKAEQEAIEKAKRASRAAKTVSGNSNGENAAPMSIRESLESQF